MKPETAEGMKQKQYEGITKGLRRIAFEFHSAKIGIFPDTADK